MFHHCSCLTAMKGNRTVLSLIDNIAFSVNCQQFECKSIKFNPIHKEAILEFHSQLKASEVICPYCGKKVYIQDNSTIFLKDYPIFSGIKQRIQVFLHRFQCTECGKVFTEDPGLLKHKGTHITGRAAGNIRQLLRYNIPISAISEITGIRWNTIAAIHKEYMQDILAEREEKLRKENYKPKHLAIDEFAVHKGHTYATCVMDLDEGDILWVGTGRSKTCFDKFFMEYDVSLLSDVEAIAMDMNASYNQLVEKYLPHAAIVYDRYHMQAQFGKDVLGSVRLEEAKQHQAKAKEYDILARETDDTGRRKQFRNKARQERHAYTKVKQSRWTLLTAEQNLKPLGKDKLDRILEDHEKLAVCYAMKEEMCTLFELTNPILAREKWTDWFEGAKASGIPQLVKFAELKEKRIDGLAAHAAHPISTGKLEGFNNKIKVAKRTGYGYRNDDYFFTLIRYLSIPKDSLFHMFC